MWCYFTKQRSTSQLTVSGYSRYLSQTVSTHSSRATHEFTQVVWSLMSKMPPGPGNVHHSFSSIALLAETFNSLLLDVRDGNKSRQREKTLEEIHNGLLCLCVRMCELGETECGYKKKCVRFLFPVLPKARNLILKPQTKRSFTCASDNHGDVYVSKQWSKVLKVMGAPGIFPRKKSSTLSSG